MVNYLLCTVLITLINIVCIGIGFFLGLTKDNPEAIEGMKEIFFRESELEEAYSPIED